MYFLNDCEPYFAALPPHIKFKLVEEPLMEAVKHFDHDIPKSRFQISLDSGRKQLLSFLIVSGICVFSVIVYVVVFYLFTRVCHKALY